MLKVLKIQKDDRETNSREIDIQNSFRKKKLAYHCLGLLESYDYRKDIKRKIN